MSRGKSFSKVCSENVNFAKEMSGNIEESRFCLLK